MAMPAPWPSPEESKRLPVEQLAMRILWPPRGGGGAELLEVNVSSLRKQRTRSSGGEVSRDPSPLAAKTPCDGNHSSPEP